MNVSEIMNTDPLIVDESAPLPNAIEQMTYQKRSCLLVTNCGALTGIVTERDLVGLLHNALEGKDIGKTSIAEVMTHGPCSIPETTSSEDALNLSRSRKIRHIPVINDDNQLVGLVTQANLLDAYLTALNDNAELSESLERLKLLSLEDPLMQIGNRRAMEIDLGFTESEAKRHGKRYSVALIDVDYFKRFNDTYGHQAGDDALRKVAQGLQKTTRSADRIYRYGGEEILALMPEASFEDAKITCERLRQSIEELAIPNEDTPLGVLTVSIGLASSPTDNWQEMVERADKALYEAKNGGRNQIRGLHTGNKS
jgi:diguanylate cyclase (GGDEF)-like protein